MRSSYIYKNAEKSCIQLAEVYLQLKNKKEEINLTNIDKNVSKEANNEEMYAKASEASEKNISKASKSNAKLIKGKKKEKKTKKVLIYAISGIVGVFILVIAGVLGYKKFSSRVTVDSLQAEINTMYTSEAKTDIESSVSVDDVDSAYETWYVKLQGKKGAEGIEPELLTIKQYIQDRDSIGIYSDENFNISSDNLNLALSELESNIKGYSVPGLVVTQTDKVSSIRVEYDNFIKLKLELQSVHDVLSFDEDKYKGLIEKVYYKPNQEELQGIYDTIVADKRAAEAQQALEQAQSEEEKAAAQQALEDAKKLQSETQKELESIQKKLEEASKQLSEQNNTITGNTGANNEIQGTEIATPEQGVDSQLEDIMSTEKAE